MFRSLPGFDIDLCVTSGRMLHRLTEVSPSLRESMTRTRSVEYISSLMKELGLKDEDLQSLVKLFEPDGKARATRRSAAESS